MKKILRLALVSLFLLLLWPFFLYKKHGNTDYTIQGRTIIISNHYSNFDAFFIYWIYGRNKKIHFVTITETKKKLWSRFITWLFDCLYIDSTTANVAFFKKSINILKDDGVICIFPEGYVNHRKYGFLDFKASYVFLARKTQAVILPLYIYPQLSFFKKSQIYIGSPFEPKDYSHLVDYDEASMHIQSHVMDYAAIIEQMQEKKTKS